MPKKETKILIIVLIMINVLSIGAFVIFYNYTIGQISVSVDKENEIKIELKKEETRTLMKDDLALGKMYQDKLVNYMIPSGGTVEFIKTLEQLVSNAGLEYNISDVTNVPYDKGSGIGAELLKINMSIIGDWSSIQYFIKSLENYPLKIDINGFSVTKVSDLSVQGKNISQWSGSLGFTVVKIKDK